MIDPGSTCTIINYPTFVELKQLGQRLTIQNSANKTRTYNGSEIRMLGFTALTSFFDTDGKYRADHKVWITEEKTSNLIGIDFCHNYLKALYFDIPAVELKDEKGVLSYGSLNNEKEYPQVSKIDAVILPQPLYIPPKSTYLYKHKVCGGDANSGKLFSKGTSFVPHRTTIKTELVFINTICTKPEKSIPLLVENHKNHQITLNKGLIGFTISDFTDNGHKYSIRDCNEFTYSVISRCEELESCFELSTNYNTISESTDFSRSCIRYVNYNISSIFDANMPIVHTISLDMVLDKGFTGSLIKRYPALRESIINFMKLHGHTSIHYDLIGYRDPDNLQLIYSLVIKDYYNSPPCDEQDLCRILCELKETLKTEGIRCIAMPKLGCGHDQHRWQQMSYELEKHFRHEGITIYVYVSGDELEAIRNMENFNFSDENISEIMETIADDTVKYVNLRKKL